MTRTNLNCVSVIDDIPINNENCETNTSSPKSFKIRRTSKNKTNAALPSDSEVAFDSDSSANLSVASNSSPRRNRKFWSDAEEACLISGVEKHGDNWEIILNDSDYVFNNRQCKDLRIKYRSLIKSSEAQIGLVIFDIRSLNEKVTEVFIGSDWSSAQWMPSGSVPNFEALLSEFETKIAAKQRMINRVSPARTPSRFISSLSINSAVKRTNASPQDENEGTPLKKFKQQQQLSSSPLSVKSVTSLKSVRSNRSNKSTKSNTQDGVLVHSDIETDSVVYPNEDGEPTSDPKSMMSRCIIM